MMQPKPIERKSKSESLEEFMKKGQKKEYLTAFFWLMIKKKYTTKDLCKNQIKGGC